MSIVSVPLTALPPQHPTKLPESDVTTVGVIDNDRKALRLAPPWHAEVMTNTRTGEVLLSPCDCMLDRDHSYAERMSWPQGLMHREG